MALQARAERPIRTGSGHPRFPTARDVFEAFPTACNEIAAKPTDAEPIAFVRSLMKGAKPEDALAFCAYLLPRREAVLWACQCVRDFLDQPTEADEAALETAEAWVWEPEELQRDKALRTAIGADPQAASTWVVRAAAWSGGRLTIGEHGGPLALPQLTAQATFMALMIALAGKADRPNAIARCIERGIQIAQTDPAVPSIGRRLCTVAPVRSHQLRRLGGGIG
jgi:hypothetical protein